MASRRDRRRDRHRDAWTTLVLGLVLAVLVGAGIYGGVRLWAHRPQPAAQEPLLPEKYRSLVVASGRTCRLVPASLIAAQLDAESGWAPDAVSPAGAQGIAQFTPAAWAQYGKDHDRDGKADPFDPADAIPSQAQYMCALAGRMSRLVAQGYAKGDVRQLTLAAYNAGPEAVVQAHGMPAFTETRTYVARIEKLIPSYEKELAAAPATTTA